MEGLRIAACLCSFISLLLLIIALATDYWVVGPDDTYTGVWRTASNSNTPTFLLMGLVAGAVSFFGLCASFCRTHIGSVSIKGLAVFASFAAGACTMIAMATFTGVINNLPPYLASKMQYGWSFGIGWASFPVFLITGGLALVLRSDPGNSP